jgi:hypothetical protein
MKQYNPQLIMDLEFVAGFLTNIHASSLET